MINQTQTQDSRIEGIEKSPCKCLKILSVGVITNIQVIKVHDFASLKLKHVSTHSRKQLCSSGQVSKKEHESLGWIPTQKQTWTHQRTSTLLFLMPLMAFMLKKCSSYFSLLIYLFSITTFYFLLKTFPHCHNLQGFLPHSALRQSSILI